MTKIATKPITIFISDPTATVNQTAIWKILKNIDHEFVPPLSARGSTVAMALNGTAAISQNTLEDYFEDIQQQAVILAQQADETIGFLSFRHNYTIEALPEFSPCNYITTIGVSNSYRGRGAGRLLYDYIIHHLPPELQSRFWVTRTWSGNNSHINILSGYGFDLAKSIDNHRGPGISTLYFAASTE